MKKYTLFFTVLCAITGMLCFSCQEESSVENNSGALGPNSSATSLLMAATENEGDTGYVIDSTHCLNIILPVTVMANNQQVQVNSANDYATVAAIFGQSTTDTDHLEYQFPIHIFYPGNTAPVSINSQDSYNMYANSCNSTPILQSGCVDISYPITILGYNSGNQQQQTYSINNNTELYGFLAGLVNNDYYTISYPITLTTPDPGTVTVNNNGSLLQFLQMAEANCGG